MKRTLIFMFLLKAAMPGYGQEEISSAIKSVQVYLRGAEVYRTTSANLRPGRNQLKITRLSATLDPNTIQIAGEGFTILSVRHESDFIENPNLPDKMRVLGERRSSLKDSAEKINLELKILTKELALLEKNSGIVGDQGIRNDDFQQAVSYFSERFRYLSQIQFGLARQKESLEESIASIDEQIKSEFGAEKKPSSNIILEINSDKAQKVDIVLSYAIKEAGWFPAYDLRASDTQSPLAISYKARVFQNSGIDWQNVKLRISSGNLESSGTAPQLSPYYIGGYGYSTSDGTVNKVRGRVIDETGQPLPQATVLVKGTSIGTSTDINGYYELQVPSGRPTLMARFLGYVSQEMPVDGAVINFEMQPDITAMEEVVVTGYSNSNGQLQGRVAGVSIRGQNSLRKRKRGQGFDSLPLVYEQINYQTTFVYDIDLPYSIPSTGKPEVVQIKTEWLDADYKYFAVPKARGNAYLMARIPGWEKLNLLDGESNLYFENRFVGKSLIDTSVGIDTLEISLGKDESIIINRQRKRDFEQQRFFSNKKREERHFEITVMNTKDEPVTVELHDQVPIAVRDNIKVNVIDVSGARLDAETGLLTWKLRLTPGDKRVLTLKYSVDHPKGQNLEIN